MMDKSHLKSPFFNPHFPYNFRSPNVRKYTVFTNSHLNLSLSVSITYKNLVTKVNKYWYKVVECGKKCLKYL